MKRVAITGAGVICALGNDSARVAAALQAGIPGIAPLRSPQLHGLRCRNGAEVRDYREDECFDPDRLPLLDRFAQFALLAARQAVLQAGIEFPPALGARTAVVTGSSLGGQSSQDLAFHHLYREGRDRVHPFTIARTMANAAASHVAMEFGITGPVFNLSTACSSSAHALGLGSWMVRDGTVGAALCGGAEAPFSLGLLKAWEAMRVLAPDTCRPFCRDRRGMILGEGAAMFVLEPEDAARARGARPLAYIAGFGMSSDAHHITQPAPDGAAAAMAAALRDARLAPDQIGYINAHGTGTQANDPVEIAAVRQVFGDHAARLAISSTKSLHGHALGAAGALEAFATLVALRDGVLPPTANFTAPDPACDLDVVPNQPRAQQVEFALSNSFAFGGLNAVLALARAD
jgi:nodulation protein E